MAKKLKTVCIFDPGHPYVRDGEKLINWARGRDFGEIEPLFDRGNMPTVYTYRRLPRSVMDRYVDAQTNDDLRALAAFRYGVVAIDGLRQGDGAIVTNWTPSAMANTSDGATASLTPEEMDMPELSRAEQIEIGSVIYNESFLPLWSRRAYPVSPSSVSLWMRLEYQSAEANPSTAPSSSERPSDQGSPQPGQTGTNSAPSESASEPATVAGAAASTG